MLRARVVVLLVVLTSAAAVDAAVVRASKVKRATSPDRLWTVVPAADVTLTMVEAQSVADSVKTTTPDTTQLYDLDTARMEAMVKNAPVQKLLAARPVKAPVITLPMADGTFERFAITRTTASDGPSPGLDLYAGVGADHPELTASIEHTANGWSAMVFGGAMRTLVTPAIRGDGELYVSSARSETPLPFRCLVEGSSDQAQRNRDLRRGGTGFGGASRVYRLAVAATGEYTTFFRQRGDSDAQAKLRARNEIGILVARLNQVYSRELGIQFSLVPRELDIIYTDPAKDPYTNGADSKLLDENQTNLDTVLGKDGYDIGHVVGIGNGGLATLHSACSASKARGETALDRPTSAGFYIDYVAHEIGHQFGANHTFNGTTGSCGHGNRNAATAYEPGSGTTIMAYAGVCGSEDVSKHSSDYFHAISLDEIAGHVTGEGACVTATPNGDNAPSVSLAMPAHVLVPAGTSFVLTATGSDPDGDALSFSFEQFDLGNASPPSDDSGGILRPILRSVLGRRTTRDIPSIEHLAGAVPPSVSFEMVPSQIAAISFRVVARDQRGGFSSTDQTLNVVKTAGPFQLTAPTAATTWRSGTTQSITWLPANTDQPPLSCSTVRISISTDGGMTFVPIIASTANNGLATVTVPAVASARKAIIRADGIGQMFFAATPAFSIEP